MANGSTAAWFPLRVMSSGGQQQYLLPYEHTVPDLCSLLAAMPLKITLAFGSSLFHLHDVVSYDFARNPGCKRYTKNTGPERQASGVSRRRGVELPSAGL